MLRSALEKTKVGQRVGDVSDGFTALFAGNTRGAHMDAQSRRLQPWAVARLAPLCMCFLGQENWSGLPFSTPGDLLGTGLQPMSLVSPALTGGFFTTASPGKPLFTYLFRNYFKLTEKKGYKKWLFIWTVLEEVANTPDCITTNNNFVLHNHNRAIRIRILALTLYCHLISFHQLSSWCSLRNRTLFRITYYIWLSCLFSVLQSKTVFHWWGNPFTMYTYIKLLCCTF